VRFDLTDGGFFSLSASFALNADGTIGTFSGGRYEWNDHNGAFRLRVLQSGAITSTSAASVQLWACLHSAFSASRI
jgi:hypothetical protein